MTKSKYIDLICILLTVAMLLGTMGLLTGYAVVNDESTSDNSGTEMAYETGLFDDSTVHTLDIVVNENDWDDLLEDAASEEYYACDLVLDGSAVQNVAIRAKGNTSLSQVASYGNDRYSLKIDFDKYQDGKNYQGLDKLALNNLIQDNTCMKDYLTYKMMAAMGAEAPLCSFIYVTVNGEDWGLYLAVEGVDESFAQRNAGSDTSQIYKPDFQNAGGPDSSSDALKLQYSDDKVSSYQEIFDTAQFDLTSEQKTALIQALKTLDSGENLSDALNVDEIIRYFVVHNFVLNGDSYTGSMLHNYYLQENSGKLSLIAWDYNLAFGGFSGGNDATALVNYPIDDPLLSGSMEDRPMIAWIFENDTYTEQYHQAFDELLSTCFDSGWFDETFENAYNLIAPYVKADDNGFVSYDDFVTASKTLQSFVTLRAKSIRGQLDGTIPSTKSGQSADDTALIDASSLSISAMGSNGMGSGGKGDAQNQNMPSQQDTTASSAQQDSGASATAASTSETGTVIPLATSTTTQTQSQASSDNTNTKDTTSSDSSSSDNTGEPATNGQMEQFPTDDSSDSSAAPFTQDKNGAPGKGGGNTPGQGGAKTSTGSDTSEIYSIAILTGGSVLLLILALILIRKYKRRRF